MASIHNITRRVIEVVPWQIRVLQLLEEQHLCAWSSDRTVTRTFVNDLAWHLRNLHETQVCLIDGAKIHDLRSFCTALEQGLGFSHIDRTIDEPNGVVGTLRRRPTLTGSDPIKNRYYIWSDAHILLKRDPELFGRLVDAMTGVAAEAEFVSEDLLLLQRAVFVGGPALDLYAEDPRGQFRRWWSDQNEPALWRIVTGVDAPKLLSQPIETLTAA